MNDALSALRGVFGVEAFPPRQKEVSLPAELLECDARELVILCAPSNDGSIDQVLALYRGPFLADFNARGASTRFVSWVERKRAEFERLFVERCRRELEHFAERRDADGIRRLVEGVLKRVAAWPEADHWLKVADAARAPSPPPPPPPPPQWIDEAVLLPAPAAASSEIPVAATPAASPSRAGLQQRWQPIALVLLTIALLVLLIRPGERHVTAPDGGGAVPSAAAAQACATGGARAQLVEEVFHYGVRLRPGRVFIKRWTLQNAGTCTWAKDFRLHHVSSTGPQLSTSMMDIPLQRNIPPGDTVMFVVPMRAPDTPGMYGEHWELRDSGDRPVAVGNTMHVVAMIRVPLPHYPACKPGEGRAVLLVKKYADGSVIQPRDSVRYSWTLRNNGECAWGVGASLRFVSATKGRLTEPNAVVTTRTVEPGETYTFLARMRVPDQPGAYGELWELRGGHGQGILVDGLPAIAMQLRVQAHLVPATNASLCQPGAAQLRFVDENWPDSSHVRPGQAFTKRWTVVNRGNCAWAPTYALRYSSNTAGQLATSTAAKPLGEVVPPGAAYTFDVPMRGPKRPGFYREDWRFNDHHGNLIMIGTVGYLAALIVVADQ